MRLVQLPERELAIDGDRPVDAESLRSTGHDVRLLGEGEARGVNGEESQAVRLVALAPGAQVGEGSDRVELGEVEEVDEARTRGRQPVDRLDRLSDPFEAGRDWRDGDVRSWGA